MMPRARALALTLTLLPALAAAGSYPMEGGDLMHSNHAQAPSSIRGPLTEQWSVAMPNLGAPNNHPLLTDDAAFMVSSYGVSAISRKDGGVLWATGTSTGTNAKTGCLDMDRNLIYVGSEFGYLQALRQDTGATAWVHTEAYTSGIYNNASPILLPGPPNRLIFGTAGAGLACMDPDTHNITWRFSQAQALNTPAYDQGQLFFTGHQSGLFCVDAATGAQVWQVNTGLQYNAAVTIDATHIYTISTSGKIEARNRSNGSLVWNYQTGSFSSSNVGICNGILVAASDDRYLYAFDAASGAMLWHHGFLGNFARMAPILICGVAYISGCASEVYGIELASGKVIWTTTTFADNSFTDISVDGDQAFFPDAYNNLHCYRALEPEDPSTCQCQLQPTPAPSPVPGPCGLPADPALSLWLDAGQGVHCDAQGRVNQWDDLSGRRHHAVNNAFARPMWLAPDTLGRRAIRFDITTELHINRSGGDLLTSTANYTVLFKLRVQPGVPGTRGLLTSLEPGGPNPCAPYWGMFSNQWQDYDWNSGVPAPLSHTAVGVYRSSSTGQEIRIDGGAPVTGPVICSSDPGNYSFEIGRAGNFGTYLVGDLYRLAVYNRVLTDAEVQAIEACWIDPGDAPAPTPAPMTPLPTPPPAYETRTFTPTFTPSPSVTPTASPTATASATATRSATATPTWTATPSATASPTNTPADTATITPTASSTPVLSATPTPRDNCDASIAQVQTWPNPVMGNCTRHVSVHLLCSADKVEVDVFAPSGCKVKHHECQHVSCTTDQWVQLPVDTQDEDLASGTYFVKATVTKGNTKAHATCKMVVLK